MSRASGRALVCVSAAVVCGSLAVSCGRGPGKFDLGLKLEKGKAYRFRIVEEKKDLKTVDGKDMLRKQVIGRGIEIIVSDVDDDGNVAAEGKYNWVLIKHEEGDRVVEFDSDQPKDENPVAVVYGPIVGRGFGCKLDRLGGVVELSGADEMVAAVVATLPLPNERAKTEVGRSISVYFGAEATKEMLSDLLGGRPKEAVAPGGTWTTSSEPGGSPVITESTWTLKEVRAGIAVLETTSKVSPDPKAAPVRDGIFSVKMTLSGEQKGTIEIDLETGLPLKGRFERDVSGDIQVTDTTKGVVVRKIATRIQRTIHVATVKDVPAPAAPAAPEGH